MSIALKLAEGLGGWLMYEHHSYRADLFSEKYLSHGIGNILNGDRENRTIAEYNHPILTEAKNWRGRNPQLDFVQLNGLGNPILAIESKFIGIGNTKIKVGDIIWDLIRLELMSYKYDITCYFILAGKKKKIHELFKEERFLEPRKNGVERPILPTPYHKSRKIQIRSADEKRLNTFKDYLKSYGEVEMPGAINTTNITYYPKDCRNFDNQVFVWEIKSLKKEPRFYPKNNLMF